MGAAGNSGRRPSKHAVEQGAGRLAVAGRVLMRHGEAPDGALELPGSQIGRKLVRSGYRRAGLGGVGGQRFVRRGYVTNTSDNTVSVIDGAPRTVTATASVGAQPQPVAVDPRTDTIYAGNLHGNSVSVINGHTSKVTVTVAVGKHPHGIAANPQTGLVYVTNQGDNTVSVLGS